MHETLASTEAATTSTNKAESMNADWKELLLTNIERILTEEGLPLDEATINRALEATASWNTSTEGGIDMSEPDPSGPIAYTPVINDPGFKRLVLSAVTKH